MQEPAHPDEELIPRGRRNLGAAIFLILFGLFDLWQSLGAFAFCRVLAGGCTPIQSALAWLQVLSGPALVIAGIVVYLRSPAR